MIDRELMAPLMFSGLIAFMLIGYPVAFSLGAVGLLFGIIGIELGYFQWALMQALPERVFGILANDLLLSIPFFTFMGAVLERCGLAEDLLEGTGQLFGPVRGGAGIRSDFCRCTARRNYRNGRGLGDCHGPDLSARHDPLRL